MSDAASITVRVPLTIRRAAGAEDGGHAGRDGGEAALPTRADPALVKALARAFRYQRLLDERALRLDQRDGCGGANRAGLPRQPAAA